MLLKEVFLKIIQNQPIDVNDALSFIEQAYKKLYGDERPYDHSITIKLYNTDVSLFNRLLIHLAQHADLLEIEHTKLMDKNGQLIKIW